MKKNDQSTRYLTLDIELESEQDMSPLVEHLGEEIFVLCNEKVESVFYTSFEPKYFEPEEDIPERHAKHILGLLDKLPDSLREMWNGCRSKIFDFGFDSGYAPCPFFTDLSPATLQGIAAIGASTRVTIYPIEGIPNTLSDELNRTETENFENMCWHDNAIHGFKIREGDDGFSGELDLDIDYILEWLPPENNKYQFKISPATLTFHDVTELVISIDYAKSTASLQPMTISEIKRDVKTYPNGHSTFSWEIEMNWPKESFLRFESRGFTQTLRNVLVISERQSLSASERKESHT